MRAVVQRVADCTVSVGKRQIGHIEKGLLVYLGVESQDSQKDIDYLTDKVITLRIFPDEDNRMNLSVSDLGLELLVVSQFTLYADARKGRRPSYIRAAGPEKAEQLYELFLAALKGRGFTPAHGAFGEMMEVSYTNLGPVTILIDSQKEF